ncbi:glycosyltransferase family 4 protein [Roseomonas chloroacetimidivorans]|uniref:glycosyltransferase family 4 protein n=1 Tax=Roseomonas chloroacetimidivorans TaxID=1766656 RepID=UPI003C72E67E
MPRIVFVLPVRGGSGGAHSVMQEVDALRSLGVDATVMVNERNIESFHNNYSRFEWLEGGVDVFTSPRDLGLKAAGADVVVATTNTSAHSIAEAIKETKAGFRTAYYVQDYEPLFYETDSVDYKIALASFSALPNCTYFAKTQWLCDVVMAAHGIEVKKVVPSIDHGIYYPSRRSERETRVLCAMVRPPTPRRAPRRTVEFLTRAASGEFGALRVMAFGATPGDMESAGLHLPENVEQGGVMSQLQVASLLREADYFVDLSDYQAFGRTAAEAMACGCTTIAPALGGTWDFIKNGVNSFLVDPSNSDSVFSTLDRMISMSDSEASAMRYAALEAVAGYTPVRAAISELRALGFA